MDKEEAPSRDQRTRDDSENTPSVGQPSTDGEVAPAALDRSFLDAVFGDTEGYAHFAIGRGAHAEGGKYRHKNWQTLVFRWPQQADEAVRTINAALSEPGLNDVYVCPNILKTDRRSKGTAVTHRLLHSDADIGLDWAKVAALRGFAVGSGSPGHAHVYVLLAREVTLAEYQVLMRGMRDYFGGDDKIADNDLLRPVGSVNHKAVVFDGQGQPNRVEWIIKRSGARMEPEAVAAVLGVALPAPDTPVPQRESRKASAASGTAETGSRDEEPVDLALYPDIRGAVGRVSGDRSADTHRIVSACFRAGLRLAQTRWAINQRDDLRERLADRTDDDVARIFLKLADEQQDQKARARTQSARDHTGDQDGDPASRANRHLRDRLLSLTDLRTLRPVQPLIDGLLYRDTLGQLSGPPGCYKTFAAIAMSCALAAGESFGAFVVPKPGKVVYVAAEGVSGLETRILAWCEVWEVDPAVLQDRLFVLPLPIQLGNQVEVSQAVAVVAEVQADLLVLDTRARCTLGLEENSATAQGEAINASDRIRTAAGCTVLGVHHSSRTGSAGRGSNAWDGAVWSDLRMDGGGLQAAIHCEKHKEVAAGCDHHFSLVRHTVSKCLMPHRLEPDRRTLVLSRTGPGLDSLSANSHRVVLDIIRTSAPDEGFTGPQIVEMAEAANVKKSTMYQALKWLVSEEYVKNIGTQCRSRYVLGDRQL
jgi:AAA domain